MAAKDRDLCHTSVTDARVFRAAAAFETATDWSRHRLQPTGGTAKTRRAMRGRRR